MAIAIRTFRLTDEQDNESTFALDWLNALLNTVLAEFNELIAISFSILMFVLMADMFIEGSMGEIALLLLSLVYLSRAAQLFILKGMTFKWMPTVSIVEKDRSLLDTQPISKESHESDAGVKDEE